MGVMLHFYRYQFHLLLVLIDMVAPEHGRSIARVPLEQFGRS